MEFDKDLQARQEARSLLRRAEQAQKALADYSQEQLDAIVHAIADAIYNASAELAEKVSRGMTENALKCKFNGGTVPIGFTVNKDQFYEIDPVKAPWVLEAFKLYGNGKTIKEIVTLLNTKGVTTSNGSKITINIITNLKIHCVWNNHFKQINWCLHLLCYTFP